MKTLSIYVGVVIQSIAAGIVLGAGSVVVLVAAALALLAILAVIAILVGLLLALLGLGVVLAVPLGILFTLNERTKELKLNREENGEHA